MRTREQRGSLSKREAWCVHYLVVSSNKEAQWGHIKVVNQDAIEVEDKHDIFMGIFIVTP